MVFILILVALAASACSSDSAPQSSEEFRAELEADVLDEIDEADLPADLEALAISSMTDCMEEALPPGSAEIDDFTDCYAERLCSSELVSPVWEGDTQTCIEEAKASFGFGG